MPGGRESFGTPSGAAWWNFVGRAQEDKEQGRADWTTGTRFGEVKGYE
ncbi:MULTISPECIES: hypothetical protein [Streptomyces]|nr:MULTISPECIES: hypothetical protein [Streptomyces]UFQ19323.1 hypothetical protein J2N69_32550 [Streptomyces huasconensis]WCL88943.1 hypothetical protein PPN52_32500 [Streptomyces sp. JCM 35825]